MARDPFRIKPQGDVGKTALLYKGDEEDLEALADQINGVKSSEVYPAFEEDFRCAIHFYDASDRFQSQLRDYCASHLTGLGKRTEKQSSSGTTLNLKWILIGILVLLFGYFVITFVTKMITTVSQVT